MLFDNKKQYATWLSNQYQAWFKQRRKGEQAATATQLGLWSGLIVAGISVSLSVAGAWAVLEQQSYNLLHQAKQDFTGHNTWDERVVVIAIDEASVKEYGRFPWPREHYTELLNYLQTAQPAAIAFDILFPDASPQDTQFAQAIAESGNVVLAVGTDSRGTRLDVTPTLADPADGFFLRGDAGNSIDADGLSRQIRLFGEQGVPSLGVSALQVYAQTMAGTTQATASSKQGVPSKTHRSHLFAPALPSVLPSEGRQKSAATGIESHKSRQKSLDISGAIAPANQNGSLGQLPIDPHQFTASLIPADEEVWIDWPGQVSPAKWAAPGDLKVYSYADVMAGEVKTHLFQNKIVLVGATLLGVDPLRTPFHQDPPTSGVYLYAATIDNLLNQSFLRRPPQWQCLLLLVTLAMGGSQLLRQQGVFRRMGAVIGFPLLWAGVAYAGFVGGWWLPVAAPIGTVILSALAVQLHEQQEKQQLMALFSMNVSPGTAELIWRHKGEILDQGELSAQNLTATVLFMDIRGFTSIAETLPSQKLLPWLNQYFETMTDCIMEHGGMVDKYIGDAIMAVFGAPVPRTNLVEIQADAVSALQAAIDMHDRLALLNYQLAAQKLPTIHFGIGIHTGPLVGGTVGNRHRLNYSLFGDTVNVAARLESMTKTLPHESPFKVLVSADTYQHAQGELPMQLFRTTQLRGRSGNTEVYAITDRSFTTLSAQTVAPAADTQPARVPTRTPIVSQRPRA